MTQGAILVDAVLHLAFLPRAAAAASALDPGYWTRNTRTTRLPRSSRSSRCCSCASCSPCSYCTPQSALFWNSVACFILAVLAFLFQKPTHPMRRLLEASRTWPHLRLLRVRLGLRLRLQLCSRGGSGERRPGAYLSSGDRHLHAGDRACQTTRLQLKRPRAQPSGSGCRHVHGALVGAGSFGGRVGACRGVV